MAKVLVSSLGTGERQKFGYRKARYKIGDEIFETSFIADALSRYLSIDKLFLIGTKRSIWDEAYTAFGGKDEDYIEFLYENKESGTINHEDLKEFNTIKKGLKSFIVDYGLNEDEIWANFEKFLEISKHIEDGDELYLDITHSFRSLSLMSFVMTQFASSISDKKFKISGVYYGMFEYSFESKDKTTPIVDIKILLEIQDWIKAIDAIKVYSDFDPLVRLLEKEGVEKNVNNAFIQLNNSIKMVNLSSLETFIKSASKKINTISNSSNKIIKLLAPEVIKLVNELNHDTKSHFQYNLAKWFFKNRNYGLSYIALYESIISKSCELKGYDSDDRDSREDAKTMIGDDRYGKFFYTKHKNSISQIRNAIAHQNSDRKDFAVEDMKRLDKYLETFQSYIYDN